MLNTLSKTIKFCLAELVEVVLQHTCKQTTHQTMYSQYPVPTTASLDVVHSVFESRMFLFASQSLLNTPLYNKQTCFIARHNATGVRLESSDMHEEAACLLDTPVGCLETQFQSLCHGHKSQSIGLGLGLETLSSGFGLVES